MRTSCWQERALDITFTDVKGEVTRRRIWPLAIVYFDRTLACLAWCWLRQDFRRFTLAAMSDVAATNESFRPRRVPLLRDYIAQIRKHVPDLS